MNQLNGLPDPGPGHIVCHKSSPPPKVRLFSIKARTVSPHVSAGQPGYIQGSEKVETKKHITVQQDI